MKQKIFFFINNFEEIIASVAISVTLLVTVVNVLFRFIFSYTFGWGDEISTMGFTWAVFVGASACYKRKMHLGVDLLTHALPAKGRFLLGLIIDSILVLGFIYLTYLGIIFSWEARIKPTPTLAIPYSFIDISSVIGFGCMAIHSIRFIIKRIRNPEIKEEEMLLMSRVGEEF